MTTTNLPAAPEPEKKNKGRPKFWTVERVKPFLIAHCGSPSYTAQALSKHYKRPCDRSTIHNLLEESLELRNLALEVQAAITDVAVGNLKRTILAGDPKWSAWWLERRARDQWSARREITGANGAPLQIEQASEYPEGYLESLTDEELEWHLRLQEKKAAANAARETLKPNANVIEATAVEVEAERHGEGEGGEG